MITVKCQSKNEALFVAKKGSHEKKETGTSISHADLQLYVFLVANILYASDYFTRIDLPVLLSFTDYNFQFDDLANITKFFDIRHYHFSRLFFSTTRWISYWLNSLHYSWGKFNPFTYRLG